VLPGAKGLPGDILPGEILLGVPQAKVVRGVHKVPPSIMVLLSIKVPKTVSRR